MLALLREDFDRRQQSREYLALLELFDANQREHDQHDLQHRLTSHDRRLERRFRPRRRKDGETMITEFFRFHNRKGGDRPTHYYDHDVSEFKVKRLREQSRVMNELLLDGLDQFHGDYQPDWSMMDLWRMCIDDGDNGDYHEYVRQRREDAEMEAMFEERYGRNRDDSGRRGYEDDWAAHFDTDWGSGWGAEDRPRRRRRRRGGRNHTKFQANRDKGTIYQALAHGRKNKVKAERSNGSGRTKLKVPSTAAKPRLNNAQLRAKLGLPVK